MIERESIKKGSIVTSIYNILGRFIGFFSIFLISFFFGANQQTDIFYFILSFFNLFTVLITSTLSTVLLPLFIKINEQSGKERAWFFLNSLFTIVVIIAILFTIIFSLYPYFILKIFSQFSYNSLIYSKIIIYTLAPSLGIMIINEFLRVIIQSHHQFTFPAKIIFYSNLFMVIFLIVFGNKFGVSIMALSVLCSQLFQCFAMLFFIVRRESLFGLKLGYLKEHKEFLLLGIPVLFAQIFASASMFFYDYSATLFTAGTLTALAFAQKIYLLPNDMIITPLANVVSPLFSELNAKGNRDQLITNFIRYNNLIWIIIIPLSIFFIFFSYPIVEVLFKRGNFSSDDVEISSQALKYYSICIFGLSFVAISTRVLYAIQKTQFISWLAIFIGIISIFLTYYFTSNLGFIGIPLTRSLSVILLSFLPGLYLVKRYLNDFPIGSVLISFFKITMSSIIAGVFSYLLFELFYFHIIKPNSSYLLFINLTVAFIVFFILYLLAQLVFNIKEFRYILEEVYRKLKQKGIYARRS